MKKSLIYLFCFPFFVFAQIPTAGLIGSWPFTGNANDESINSNNGIVTGATLTTDRFGTPNRAYNFDGVNDQIVIPASPELYRYNTSFTISAWVRQSATPPGFSQPIFTNRTNSAGSEFYIDGAGNGTGMEGYLGFATWNNGVYGICRSINQVPINNGYQHVVVTFQYIGGNNNVAKVYVNGSLNNMETDLVNIPLSTEDTYIGWGPNFIQSNRHFEGDIDDIFLYNRELSSSEVLSLYTVTTAEISENEIYDVAIFPNPANDILNMVGKQGSIKQIVIYNLDGKIIYENEFTNIIDVSSYVPGVYFLYLVGQNENQFSRFKFVKL